MSPVAVVLARPRWIVLTLLAILAVALCVLGGTWQWTRTHDILALERAAVSEPVDAASLTTVGQALPVESIGRPVEVTGRYDATRQRYVANRALDGRAGLWVVTPVDLEDGTSVAVLRGWVPEERPGPDAPPDVTVRVLGVLQPGDTFYDNAPLVDGGRLVAISDEALRELWGDGVRPGVVVLREQEPASTAGPRPVPPTVIADVPFPLQNFFYAFQWWFFAAFVVFLWVRYLRMDVKDLVAERAQEAPRSA